MNTEAPTPQVWAIDNRIIEHDAKSTPLRIYLPNSQSHLPLILLIHGGAWVAGNLDTHDNLARYLCSQAEAIVISIDYTLSPEGKFPLPLLQSYDALKWIIDHASQYSTNSSRLAIVGDSAGGNMVAAFCFMMRDLEGPTIDLQVLINPAPDLTCKGTLTPQNDALDILRWQALQYLSDPQEASHPYVSPLVAPNLKDLPEAVVILAEKDELREAGQQYAHRMIEAGIPTHVYFQSGIGHLAGKGARASLEARESLDVAVAALRKTFSENKKKSH
jgi:acetyl esterase